MTHFFEKYKYYLSLFGAALCYTFLVLSSAYLSKIHINLFEQVFWRLLLGTLFAGLICAFQSDFKIEKREIKYLLINTFIFLAAFITFAGGIALGTPIAKAVALNYSYPLIVIFLSYLLFKELPALKHLIAIIISLLSVGLLIEVWKIKNLSQIELGDFVAWLNSWFYGAILVFGRKLRLSTNLKPFKTIFYSHLFALPLLFMVSFIFVFFDTQFLAIQIHLDFSFQNWLIIIVSTFFGSIAPLALIYIAISKVKPVIASLILLTEPLWVYIGGLLFFDQSLSLMPLIGIFGIISAVLLI